MLRLLYLVLKNGKKRSLKMSSFGRLLSEGITSDASLETIYDIESVLLVLDEINKKIDYYKDLKKHRAQAIDEKISRLTGQVGVFRQVIQNTMDKRAPNQKTLDFPSVGKVSKRKAKDSWVVDDEEQVLNFLDSKGQKAEVVKIVESIDRRKLATLLGKLTKQGETIPGATMQVGSESISITIDKDENKSLSAASIPEGFDIEQLDALEV